MNPITMLRTAAALLTIAAVGGIVMATARFMQNSNPPSWIAMLHGLLAAAGLTLLFYATLTVGLPLLANAGLGLLVVAALLGVVLNQKYQWRAVLLPSGLVIGHILFAVTGFLLVLITAWKGV
jgi:hypothetical protein